MIKIHIGQKIKLYREKRGKTLQGVAEHLGVTEATVQRYESGNIKNLKLDTISKIASYLNVSPAYLMGWEEIKPSQMLSQYDFFPTAISAGLPIEVDGITESEKISIPDALMGRWAGNSEIFIVKANGQSMNKTIPDQSLMAVKPIELSNLKNDDIVVYSDNHDYSVKRYYDDVENERIIFRPHSTERIFIDDIYHYDNLDSLKIHGKVVVYTVELD